MIRPFPWESLRFPAATATTNDEVCAHSLFAAEPSATAGFWGRGSSRLAFTRGIPTEMQEHRQRREAWIRGSRNEWRQREPPQDTMAARLRYGTGSAIRDTDHHPLVVVAGKLASAELLSSCVRTGGHRGDSGPARGASCLAHVDGGSATVGVDSCHARFRGEPQTCISLESAGRCDLEDRYKRKALGPATTRGSTCLLLNADLLQRACGHSGPLTLPVIGDTIGLQWQLLPYMGPSGAAGMLHACRAGECG